jgi:hypothetical protein
MMNYRARLGKFLRRCTRTDRLQSWHLLKKEEEMQTDLPNVYNIGSEHRPLAYLCSAQLNWTKAMCLYLYSVEHHFSSENDTWRRQWHGACTVIYISCWRGTMKLTSQWTYVTVTRKRSVLIHWDLSDSYDTIWHICFWYAPLGYFEASTTSGWKNPNLWHHTWAGSPLLPDNKLS